MSLAAGRHFLSIPGPSVMPERVLRAMHQGAPNIYEGALMETTEKVLRQLCEVARTEGRVAHLRDALAQRLSLTAVMRS